MIRYDDRIRAMLHRQMRVLRIQNSLQPIGSRACLAVPAAFVFFFIMIFAMALLVWSYGVSRVLFGLALASVFLLVECGFIFLIRRLSTWGVKAEFERWLAEPQSEIGPHERSSRIGL